MAYAISIFLLEWPYEMEGCLHPVSGSGYVHFMVCYIATNLHLEDLEPHFSKIMEQTLRTSQISGSKC